MFDDFQTFDLAISGVNIHGVTAGNGPPLLLLHGYPQSHLIWHRVAPLLSKHYTVVATDLRGYGHSGKPAGGANREGYSKRNMASDQVGVMRALGHETFFLCGHDRGGRVAHRLAMDSPHAVKRLMTLDISPTLAMVEQTDATFSKAYWWWSFLIQATPFPEQMILANPEGFLRKKIGWGHAGLACFTDQTYAAYLAAMSDPATVHAMCEDYRAAVGIDLEHDRADRLIGDRLTMPLRVLWGEFAVINRCFDPLADWQAVATTVSGQTLPCGHYLPEEAPDELTAEMCAFFID